MNKVLLDRIDKIIREAEVTVDQAGKIIYKLHALKVDIDMCSKEKAVKKGVRNGKDTSNR